MTSEKPFECKAKTKRPLDEEAHEYYERHNNNIAMCQTMAWIIVGVFLFVCFGAALQP